MNIANIEEIVEHNITVSLLNNGKYLVRDNEHIFETEAESEEDALNKYDEIKNFVEDTEFREAQQQEFIDTQYQRDREYPPIEDQLDMIFLNGIDAWKADIQAIKDKYPKPENN